MHRFLVRGVGPVLLLSFLLLSCRTAPLTTAVDAAPDGTDFSATRLKLLVAEEGVYEVTPELLAGAGLEVQNLTAANAHLSDGEQAVPAAYRDGSLYFYGRPSASRYFAARPYLLELGRPGVEMTEAARPALTAAVVETVIQTARLEENHNYVSEARQEDGDDVWFWSKLTQQDAFTAEIDLPAVSNGAGTLQLNALGITHNREIENDHDVEVLVNDVPAGSIIWDGPVLHTGAVTIPDGTLRPGTNTITIDNRPEGANFLDIMDINWLEVSYNAPATAVNGRLTFPGDGATVRLGGFSPDSLLLQVSDPAQPQVVPFAPDSSGQLEVPAAAGTVIAAAAPQGLLTPQIARVRESDWRDGGRQADLLIITTDALAPAVQPLVAARQAQGLSVAVIPVDEIYDAFGSGAPSPESIQRFVAYAYEEWAEPQPRYVLLVGDATSDYLGYLGEPPPNLVPSPMVPVQFSGETVSDSRLGDVDGDLRPDLAVGRWPVRTVAEVEDLVARTIAYEETPASTRTIFATDGSEEIFAGIAQQMATAANLPAAQNVQLDGPTAVQIAGAWQEGAWLATYIGHGSIDRWGKEDILNLESAAALQSTAMPIVLQLTCLTGLFSHPVQTSLAEAMLLNEAGPVLLVAASSLTLSTHQEPFALALLQQLQDREVERMGDAFLAAKQTLDVENSAGLREISDTFGLLGDPSARIARP